MSAGQTQTSDKPTSGSGAGCYSCNNISGRMNGIDERQREGEKEREGESSSDLLIG